MTINPSLLFEIKSIITTAKDKAIRAIDNERVLMYWHIGKVIFEEEQQGKDRADYGSYLIRYLSEQLQPEFGSGFSRRQLEMFRQFYRMFPIAQTGSAQLTWSHYTLLLRIDNKYKREYYIAETSKNTWTVRQLERQINSQLYERLLLSNDKESVLTVACNEKLPHENATIGILLCADKNNTVVKYSLPQDNNQISASRYELYLPTEQQLLTEMKKEIARFA